MTPPHTEISVSDARARLPELIANLPATLLHYGKPVADLVPHTTPDQHAAAERDQLRQAIEMVEACGSIETVDAMDTLGMRSIRDVHTLLARIKGWKAVNGYPLDPDNLSYVDDLPEPYQGDIDVILAYMHLDNEDAERLRKAGADLVAWSNAIAEIRSVAIATRKDSSALLGDSWRGEDKANEIDILLASGVTPEEFTRRGLALVAQGVAVKDIVSTFDAEAIPADVLAISPIISWRISDMRQYGISLADACTLVRRYRDNMDAYQKAIDFARARATSVDDLIKLIDSGWNTTMAIRAAHDGVPASEWMPLLPKLAKTRHAVKGLLPFRVIAQAVEEGVSVLAWDKLPVAETSTRYRQKRGWSQIDEPFAGIYGGRILELAREGIVPGFVVACWNGRDWFLDDGGDFVDQVIGLRRRGLRLDVMKYLGSFDARQPSVEERRKVLHKLLDLEATAVELAAIFRSRQADLGRTAAELEVMFGDGGWVSTLTVWRNSVPAVAAWVKQIREDDEKGKRFDVAAAEIRNANAWTRRNRVAELAIEATEVLDKHPGRLHRGHVEALLWSAKETARNMSDMVEWFNALEMEFNAWMRQEHAPPLAVGARWMYIVGERQADQETT